MKVAKQQKWQNWSGSVRCRPENIFYPKTEQEIVAIVRQSAEQNKTVRVVGSGHSFCPLIETDENIVCLKDYSGIEHIDVEKCQAVVKSGTGLRALGKLLAEHGMAMENLGDIDRQTISGVVGTGTHGTGRYLGNISTQVVSMTIVTGDGEIIECSQEQNEDVFKAAQISLGSLGIISKLRLRLVPLYYLKVKKRCENFEECLSNLSENIEKYRHYEFFWFPYSDFVYTKSIEITEQKQQVGMIKKYISDVILENLGLWCLGFLSRIAPSKCRTWANLAKNSPDGEEIDQSYRIFTSYRWVRFQEMEYSVPLEHGAAALREVRDWIEREKFPVLFPIEFRFVKEDDIWLSPAYQRPVVYIAMHTYKGMPYLPYFQACEKIFSKWQGRPHWGKMHFLEADQLQKLYPKWEQFQDVRKRLDPKGIFLNRYLRKLFEEKEST